MNANDLITFLNGKWDNISFSIKADHPVEKEHYPETMSIKNFDTITITAHGYLDGKDHTRDMFIEVRDNHVRLAQGNFEAIGYREGNVYYLKGTENNIEYRFRLYTLKDKYVFHREIWKENQNIQIDMSYLIRQ